jgi:hypothetical protein
MATTTNTTSTKKSSGGGILHTIGGIVGGVAGTATPLGPVIGSKIGGAAGTEASNLPSQASTAAGAVESVGSFLSYTQQNATYMAVWVGLFVLGLVLIIKGISGGGSDQKTRLVPVPA